MCNKCDDDDPLKESTESGEYAAGHCCGDRYQSHQEMEYAVVGEDEALFLENDISCPKCIARGGSLRNEYRDKRTRTTTCKSNNVANSRLIVADPRTNAW